MSSSLDLSNESPSDVAVTLRSLPRRFREAVEPHGNEDVDALVRTVGPDGASALDQIADTGRLLALLGSALKEVVSGRQPVLQAAVTDPGARQWEHPADDLEGELGLLSEQALELAGQVERTPADQWTQVGQVVGGAEMTALDLARETVHAGVGGLRATEKAIAHARTH